MEDHNWSSRDLSGIKFRRPEGGAECSEWEKRFSLFWSSEGAANDDVGNLDEQVLFVKDSSSSSGGRSMTGDRVFSSNAQEFEFNISSSSVESSFPSATSPADELFFRGKLLPLHLPPRLQMVLKLSSEKLQESDRNQRCLSKIIPPLKLPDPVLPQKAFTSCTVASKVASLSMSSNSNGSRSPDFRRNSWLDPRERDSSTDRDSSRESSSSRDSSGSSQDTCFNSGKELRTTSASENKASLHNREVFNSHSSATPNLHAWLRPPFKWKILFGAKRSTKAATEQKGQQRRPLSPVLDDNFMLGASNPDCFGPRLSERYFSDCSGELSYSGDIGKAARAFERASMAEGDQRERDQTGLAKAREYIQKYMKILKPLNVKRDAKADADQESSRPGSCKVTYANRQALFLAFDKRSLRATSSSRSLPSFSRSSRFAPATNVLVTPRQSPVLRSVGTPLQFNSVSEIHGAIQGAIAHCKESQINKP